VGRRGQRERDSPPIAWPRADPTTRAPSLFPVPSPTPTTRAPTPAAHPRELPLSLDQLRALRRVVAPSPQTPAPTPTPRALSPRTHPRELPLGLDQLRALRRVVARPREQLLLARRLGAVGDHDRPRRVVPGGLEGAVGVGVRSWAWVCVARRGKALRFQPPLLLLHASGRSPPGLPPAGSAPPPSPVVEHLDLAVAPLQRDDAVAAALPRRRGAAVVVNHHVLVLVHGAWQGSDSNSKGVFKTILGIHRLCGSGPGSAPARGLPRGAAGRERAPPAAAMSERRASTASPAPPSPRNTLPLGPSPGSRSSVTFQRSPWVHAMGGALRKSHAPGGAAAAGRGGRECGVDACWGQAARGRARGAAPGRVRTLQHSILSRTRPRMRPK
jgi:hypothetical protein